MGEMKFQQPEFTILVNDRKNSQRKGSGTGEKQEFINLWTSLLLRNILSHEYFRIQ
jgi:hypothetical protein